ncbi:MAG: hypothetical protein ACE37F_04620 [Nannocystaceae bacterium]|nr:hypothetical protein [bacterium]
MSTALQRWALVGGVALWAGFSIMAQTTLMAGHWYTLPSPDPGDGELQQSLAALVPARAEGSWAAVHVLYSACRCSQRVFDHLFESPRPDGVYETVLLVGADEEIERRAAAAGFDVRVLTPEALESEFGIVSAPLLLVLGPSAELRYAGGYTERKQGYDVQDVQIIETLQAGDDPAELPLYGCGVSKELQQLLDPMGLKYD